MIGYLNGLIIDVDPAARTLLVLTQDVGYKVTVNTALLSHAQNGQKISLFIHTAVREDDIALYGFANKDEKMFFNQLIGVSGIGPKMAMEILSAPLRVTQNAIMAQDPDMLTKIKGIGKKTAERIVLELKGKVTPVATESGAPFDGYNEDAVQALQGLGYEKMHIVKVIAGMPADVRETAAIVKYFLKQAT